MNFIKKFLGTTPTDEVALIPSGKLFLTRSPQLPKGEIECLYNDAFASIRQTTAPFYYQLCIVRAYQEGELAANGATGFNDSDDEDFDGRHSLTDESQSSKDEWTFAISGDLKIHTYNKADGSRAIAWTDLNGDLGDKFEFIIDEDVKFTEVDSFVLFLYKCLYEQKYQRSSHKVKDMDQLKEFVYDPKAELLTFADLKRLENDYKLPNDDEGDSSSSSSSEDEFEDTGATFFPPLEKALLASPTVYESTDASLHLFDSQAGAFKVQKDAGDVTLKIVVTEPWNYLILLVSATLSLEAKMNQQLNPTLNYDFLSLIFNYFPSVGGSSQAYSWLIKFADTDKFLEFRSAFTKTLWEAQNQRKWGTADEADYCFITKSMSGLFVSDSESDEDEEEEDEDDEEEAPKRLLTRRKPAAVEDDDYDDDENERQFRSFRDENKNSGLAVGYSNNRSYVVRGDKLGVFSNSNDELNFQTTIGNLKDLKGATFNPDKLMLHQQDQYMVMSNSGPVKDSLYKMDLTRGKIVEQWDVKNKVDESIAAFTPNSKFSQLTNEQTLTGLAANTMFQIDPRLAGSNVVNDQTFKGYSKTAKNNFLSITTSENGYLAVGSTNGDLRLYDRLGVNAKTALPSLGEPVVGVDVSKDGRWVLATYATFLLVIDTLIGEGQKNAGALGFEKYFDKDKKPEPRRLTVRPEHFQYMVQETGTKSLNFTRASFNTGLTSKETTIVTSHGPYLISWSLKDILNKKKPNLSYTIQRYDQQIIADNFRFNSNSEVIVALRDDVSMIDRRELRKATKESLLGKRAK